MDSDTLARVTYLGLIAVAVAGALIVQNRNNLGRLAQQFSVWGLIFVGLIAGYGLWSDISRQILPRQSVISDTGQIVLPRAGDGHFYVNLTIQGVPVHFVVDTGATDMVLTQADARRLGIDTADLAYLGRASTANGVVRTARVTLHDVKLAGMTVPSVSASVNKGAMDTSLLGMSFLRNFQSIEMKGNRMVLTP